MKYQKGFAPLVIVFLVMLGIGAAGGGYITYKDKQQYKKFHANLEKFKNEKGTEDSNSQPTPSDSKVENKQTVAVNTPVSTKINCDNNWSCLISAANKCQAASGIITYSNFPNPLVPAFLNSGKTKYEIKPSGTNCILSYSFLEQSINFSDTARADMLKEGRTNIEIDMQIKLANDSYKSTMGTVATCVSNTTTISSYLSDQKRGVAKGDFDIDFSAEFSGSTSITTVGTSSGQKLKCSTPQPSPKFSQ